MMLWVTLNFDQFDWPIFFKTAKDLGEKFLAANFNVIVYYSKAARVLLGQ